MVLKKVVYKERSTSRWAAEVINIDDPATIGVQVWRGVYDSEGEAHEAAQREMANRMGLSSGPSLKADRPQHDN